jgi:hypothetical protein
MAVWNILQRNILFYWLCLIIRRFGVKKNDITKRDAYRLALRPVRTSQFKHLLLREFAADRRYQEIGSYLFKIFKTSKFMTKINTKVFALSTGWRYQVRLHIEGRLCYYGYWESKWILSCTTLDEFSTRIVMEQVTLRTNSLGFTTAKACYMLIYPYTK